MAGIILYLIALTYALTVQRSAVARPRRADVDASARRRSDRRDARWRTVRDGTDRRPAAAPEEPAGGPPAASRPGPPPRSPRPFAGSSEGGIFTGLLILVIVFLMVTKPGLGG